MKNVTRLIVIMMLCVSWLAKAQQWSDVSLGISPTPPYTTTNPTFTMDMAIHNNVPHVLIHTTGNILAVMTYSAGVWTSLPTPTPPASANATGAKIAIDASGTIYVAYYTQAGNSLQVKKYNGTAWVTVGALGFASNDGPQALMIDPSTNFPIIVTRNQTGTFNLSAYRFNGTSWSIIGAAGFTPTVNYSRAAVSSTGTPYVLFDQGAGKFSVMKFDGASWVLVGAASFGDYSASSAGTDIAVDATGTPYVITQSTTTLKSSVSKYNGTAWVTVGATDFTPGAAHQARLNFNGTGSLHMVFQDATSGNKITAMRFNGTAWVGVGSPAFSGGGGRWPIIDFDGSNTPYVLFHDALLTNNNGSLMKLCSSNTATVTSTTPGTLCGSGSVTLSAASAGTLRWYNAATNGAYVGAGSSYVTPSLSTTTTYSVAAYDANSCSSPRTSVIATIKPIPTITSTNNAFLCAGNPGQPIANVSAGTTSWYTVPTGGVPEATGVLSLYNTPPLNSSVTYYVEAVNNGCVSTPRSVVTATVYSVPATPTAVSASRCGTGAVALSVNAVAGTVNWYNASVGGSIVQASSSTFTTPTISNTTTYYTDVTSAQNCVSQRVAVIATIKTLPTVTFANGNNRCGSGTVTFSAGTSAGTVDWYAASTGGVSLGSGTPFSSPSVSTTTTFYAEANGNGCVSSTRTAVIATINPIPSIASANVSRCDAGTVTFEAGSVGSISWFGALTGGSVLGTGANFTTPSISVTTPYFIEATLNGCTTAPRTQVSAIVNTSPPQPAITQNNANIEAPVLTSNSATGNQWFKDDVAVGSAIANTYTISDQGSYKVQVTLNGCVSPFSNTVSYVITGFETSTKELLKLFPNPTADELVIDLNGFDHEKLVSVAVIDLLGRPVMESLGMGGDELRFDVRSYQQGQYIVLARQGLRKATRTFIKSH